MDAEKLMLEIAARDLTGDALQAIVRNIGEIRAAAVEASRATGEMGGKGAGEADKLGQALGSVTKIAAGVFTGIKLTELLHDMADFHTATMNNVGGLGSLADRFGVTTDQLQAFQGAARRANVTNDELNKTLATFNLNVGQARQGSKAQLEAFETLGIKILDVNGNLRPMPDLLNEAARALLLVENSSQRAAIGSALLGEKGARLTPLLRELADPIGNLVDRGKAFGEIVDREIIDKLDRSKNASEAAQQQFQALYATVAAPLHAQGMEYLAALTSDLTRRIREAKGSWIDMMASIMSDNGKVNSATMGGLRLPSPAEQNALDLEKYRGILGRLQAERNSGSPTVQGRESMIDADIELVTRKIRDLEAADRALAQSATNAAAQQRLVGEGLPPADTFHTGGSSNTKVRPTGGAGSRDRIEEAVNQLRGELAAAQTALDTLRGDAAVPLDKLEREVELRKRIADEIAKLGKYDPKDPRVGQIADLVRQRTTLDSAIEKTKKAMQDADETERRAGDGTLYLRTETERLNEALDTGRLTYETYAASMKAATDQADLMRLKLEGAQGGVEGFVAGLKYAAKQQEMNNSVFALGQKAYSQTIDGLTEAFTRWRKTGQLDMGQFLASWIDMLAQMAMQAAAMQVFGGLTSFLGIGGNSYVPAITATTNTIPDIGTLIGSLGLPGFAEGGRPPMDRPSIIGERGPELWQPDTAGRVIPLDDPGGGVTLVFHNTNQFGSVVSRAEMEEAIARNAEATRKAAIAGVADAKSRGGAYRANLRR